MGNIRLLVVAVVVAALSLPALAEDPGSGAPTKDEGAESASHREVEPLAIEFERLTCLRFDAEGNLLAGDAGAQEIKVINAAGKVAATIKPRLGPEAMDVAAAGTIYCGGQGRLAKLDADGLRGCCQRCDLVARDGIVYLAENTAHRVVLFDPEGNVLDKWGTKSRTELEGFGSCCNPMNLGFDAGGTLYTAESGLGRVKRYTTDGRFLGLVGYVGVDRFTSAGRLAASCSNIAIAVTPEGDRVYVVDLKNNLIRVLQKKG